MLFSVFFSFDKKLDKLEGQEIREQRVGNGILRVLTRGFLIALIRTP